MEWDLKAGDLVAGWTLIKGLDEGGNGQVWVADHRELGRAALKLLKLKFQGERHKRYLRFRDEAKVHQALAGNPGVLPFLGCRLPENPTRDDPAWLATSVAQPVRKALKGRPLREAIEAVAAVAGTLAALHEQGISHRDIKPENLFKYQDRWVVGDFGLVDYPDKESLTVSGERLGPYHYLAPEMHDEAKRSDGRKADVYSLGKTLWVLAANENTPPPGELRSDNLQIAIRMRVANDRARQLDDLVERATAHDPDARPSMKEFANELEAWLTPAEVRPQPDITDALARIRDLAARVIPRGVHMQDLKVYFDGLVGKLRTVMSPIAQRFAQTTLSDGQCYSCDASDYFYGPRHARRLPPGASALSGYICRAFCPLPSDESRSGVELVGAAGAGNYPDGRVVLFGGYQVSVQWHKSPPAHDQDWKKERVIGPGQWDVPSGSAQADKAVAELASFLNENLGEALGLFTRLVEEVAPSGSSAR